MIHDWLNGPGYMDILDDSLVSSAHLLGYGDKYFLHDDNAPCHRAAIVKEWNTQHDVRTAESWPKAHRELLGRYQA